MPDSKMSQLPEGFVLTDEDEFMFLDRSTNPPVLKRTNIRALVELNLAQVMPMIVALR